jgi:hypothetical protein
VTSVSPGVYDLEVLDAAPLGAIIFSATTTARPADFAITGVAVQSAHANLAFQFDSAPEPGTALRFYIDTDASGYDGTLLGSVADASVSGNLTADLAGLAPGEYFVYAVTDGIGIPQFRYAPLPLDYITDQGTEFNDFLIGSDGVDFIQAFAGNDRVDLKSGKDLLHGGAGTDTAIIFTPFQDLANFIRTGNVIEADTLLGHKQLVDVERIQLKGATVYFDTGPNEPSWEAYMLLKAGLGTSPPGSLLGVWLPTAVDDLPMGDLAQQMLNYYAPGISTAAVVDFLFQRVLHVPPTAEQASFVIDLVGPGKYFANNGDLFAYAASMDQNTAGDPFTGQPYVLHF